MKTTKPEHAQIDATAAGIPAAEPVFLLRAQDVHAQAAVRFYADRVQAAGGDQNVISAARQSVTDFAAWPTKKEPTFEPDAPADVAADELAATAAQLIAAGVKVGDVIIMADQKSRRVVALDPSGVVLEEVTETPAADPVDPLTPGTAIEKTVTEQPRRRSREA